MKNYTFDEYQKETRKTAVYGEIGHPIVFPVIGLFEEAGELAGKVKKMFRDHGGELDETQKELIQKELGDILWYLTQACTELGVTLEDTSLMNLEKINSRLKRNTIHGEGDDR
jgi:NTP pyrophosphatase (non-canonical NTP hydrolase)